jgi:hypothetical protein
MQIESALAFASFPEVDFFFCFTVLEPSTNTDLYTRNVLQSQEMAYASNRSVVETSQNTTSKNNFFYQVIRIVRIECRPYQSQIRHGFFQSHGTFSPFTPLLIHSYTHPIAHSNCHCIVDGLVKRTNHSNSGDKRAVADQGAPQKQHRLFFCYIWHS